MPSHFFQIATPATFFSDSHEAVHTWFVCQYAKNVEQIFKNFDFKIFGGFLTFQFGLSYGAM